MSNDNEGVPIILREIQQEPHPKMQITFLMAFAQTALSMFWTQAADLTAYEEFYHAKHDCYFLTLNKGL